MNTAVGLARAVLEPLQKEYARLTTDPGAINELLAQGRDRAMEASLPRLRAAERAMGLWVRERHGVAASRSRAGASVGRGLRSNSALAVMVMAWVQ